MMRSAPATPYPDPYGRILTETWKAGDAMVVSELDGTLLSTPPSMWIRPPARIVWIVDPTTPERDTRN
jgi:hypothetical protein